jgi:Tol biopolymer transport system component
VGIWRFSRSPNVVPLPPIEVLPLAGLSGFEVQPAFSPDGNHVAFVLHAANYSGIYTAMIDGQKSLRLTTNSGDCCPTWSPDGREIAFSRPSDSGVDIYVIPALGGTEHRVFSWPPEGHQVSTLPPWRVNGRSLDWSPNGKVLAFSDTQPDKTHAWIALLSVADSTIRPLTSPPSETLDYGPAFSPDGSMVAHLDIWASYLDSGWSRNRLLIDARRSRGFVADTRFRRYATAGSRRRCGRGVPFYFSKR